MSAGPETLLAARVSRAELVARELEREIVDDRQAGERLGTKDDLRKRFGVAVATVNEAVRLLETRGLIEAQPGPGGGVFVSGIVKRIGLRPRSTPARGRSSTRPSERTSRPRTVRDCRSSARLATDRWGVRTGPTG